MSEGLLAVIPARGGSKALPRKALQPLAGLPLIAHTIELARRCPDIDRTVVSTDSDEIAEAAQALGADVPFLRPPELAQDDTPMWPVVRHALDAVESVGEHYGAVLLLQPTSPMRLPDDVGEAIRLLREHPEADGVLGVSEPSENPISAGMTVRGGFLVPLFPDAYAYTRRQDTPPVLVVNGALYLWRARIVRDRRDDPGAEARYVGLTIPARRAIDVDTGDDLELADAVLRAGLVSLPWLG